ncbi:MAG: hypothetical protein ABS951_05480 [Solibacillus sp.]
MRIGQIASQWVMQQTQQQKQLEQPKPAEPQNFIEQAQSAKETIKETAQRVVAEIQEAQNEMGDDDPKVQSLMEKFKNGRKLTSEEMSYIRKNAPGQMHYIDRIMREREMMELSMRMAPSKMEVQTAILRISKNIEKGPEEDREVLTKHLMDAKQEYEKTDEYREKPNSPLDREERPLRVKYKKNPQIALGLQTYEQPKHKKVITINVEQ